MSQVDVLGQLSDEMKQVMDYINQHAATISDVAEPLTYPQMRLNYQQERQFWNEGGPEMAKTLNELITVADGQVATRVYYPNNNPTNNCIFFIHGGGFIVGNLDTHDRVMRLIAAQSHCVVIGIDYSLSPEAKFPQAIEECVAITRYYRQHAAEYGINPQQMGYAGDSAGAYLCLATFLWQRDAGDDVSFVKGLLLYYGLYGLKDSRSMRLYGGEWDGLTPADLIYYRDMYLADETQAESPYYCLFNNDLTKNMAPCFVASCEYDPLIDDSETLYAILNDHQICCEYKMYPGTLHAFLHYSKMMPTSVTALDDGIKFFLSQLD